MMARAVCFSVPLSGAAPFLRTCQVLTSVIIKQEGVLEVYSVLRGVPEVSLWCLKMSKYVSDEDASFTWDVFNSQGVSLRCP